MKTASKELAGMISAAGKKGTSPLDTQATVVRVEGNIAWVHIPGGVDETPARLTMNAKPGDTVQVRVAGGRAWLTGNASAPPTDNTEAYRARDTARQANETAEASMEIADQAERFANEASEAADQAWAKADSASRAADQAWGKAEDAKQAAELAVEKSEEATEAAQEAQNSAYEANKAASGAITQLGVVEDVIGTLNWISEHGTYEISTDTEVAPGKHYFSRQGDTYNIIVNPTGNPSDLGYYELTSIDEAVSNYVSSHLALTDQGLWVTKDNNAYKILLASDGMRVYDNLGNLVATFGESIQFASDRPQYIGGEDAYIVFYDSNSDGIPDAINIGGSKVTIMGNKRLSDLLTSLDISTRQTADGAEISVAGQTVSLKDGEDAAVLRIDSSRGTVFKNNQVSTVLTVSIYRGSLRITNITDLRREFGATAHLQWYWQKMDESDFGIIVASDHKLSDDGFTLTLTPDEVDTKVTFMCELITD